MRIPNTTITRWGLGSSSNIYREDGNIGIGMSTPNEKLTIASGAISVQEIATPDATAGYYKIYIGTDGALHILDPSGNDFNIPTAAIENQRWEDSSEQRQDIRDALDGYDIYDSDYTIYVDPTGGDDTGTGTIGDPIQTIQELTQRASLTGVNVIGELLAGSHELPLWPALLDKVILRSLGTLTLRCAMSVVDTFTFASSADNVWTASGSPGWTIDEHEGQLIEWEPWGPGSSALAYVISNTVDTVTLAYLPNSITGGYLPAPAVSTSVEIQQFDAKIIPDQTLTWGCKLHISGSIRLEKCWFDGTDIGEGQGSGAITGFLPGSNLTAVGCKFTSWSGTPLDVAWAVANVESSWFEDCPTAVYTDGFLTFSSGNVFINCTSCIESWSRVRSVTPAAIFIFNCTNVVSLRGSSHFQDFFSAVWLDTVTNYVQLDSNCSYIRENTPVKIWSGKEQPSVVVDILAKNANVSFEASSVAATMTGTTAYIDMNGTLITHADYITDLSFMDENHNQVSG